MKSIAHAVQGSFSVFVLAVVPFLFSVGTEDLSRFKHFIAFQKSLSSVSVCRKGILGLPELLDHHVHSSFSCMLLLLGRKFLLVKKYPFHFFIIVICQVLGEPGEVFPLSKFVPWDTFFCGSPLYRGRSVN